MQELFRKTKFFPASFQHRFQTKIISRLCISWKRRKKSFYLIANLVTKQVNPKQIFLATLNRCIAGKYRLYNLYKMHSKNIYTSAIGQFT